MKISNSQYAKILYSMVDGKSESQANSAIFDFSKFLIKKRGAKRLEKIIRSFSKTWNTEKKIVDCEVFSVEKMSNENMKKIENYILDKYRASIVNLKNVINKEIRGGVIVKVGDEIIDASVEGQLKRLKKQLAS